MIYKFILTIFLFRLTRIERLGSCYVSLGFKVDRGQMASVSSLKPVQPYGTTATVRLKPKQQ